MSVLDIFSDNAFSCIELTDAIATPPFVPGRAGQVVPWQETPVSTRTIMVEQIDGELGIVNPTPYGGVGQTFVDPKRTAFPLAIPHYQIDDSVMAEEVRGVREFGTENQLRTVANLLSQRMADRVQNKMDPTLEYQRLGALKGIILNGDGSTYLNLFTAFGVSQEAEVAFDLSNATPASGALRKVCASIVRTMATNLKGLPMGGVIAECSDTFFDALIAHPEVVLSYRNTDMAEVLRQGYVFPNGQKIYGAFEFGGIIFENYRGAVIAGTSWVAADKCHMFPLGVPGLYRTVLAPADYIETVNTPGLRRYARQWVRDDGKGVSLQMQMNTLNFCARPKVLMKGKLGA